MLLLPKRVNMNRSIAPRAGHEGTILADLNTALQLHVPMNMLLG